MTDQHNSLDNDGMSETEDSSVPSKLKPNLTRSLVGNKNSVEGILQHWKGKILTQLEILSFVQR